jgi:cytochrome P450
MFSGVNENFSFHSSPEAFLVARIVQHRKDHPEEVRERAPVRAKILNRNVVIVSSFRQIQEVLGATEEEVVEDDAPPYVAVPAYKQLMQEFFPPPNLLLQDGKAHERMKEHWKKCAHSLESSTLKDSIDRMASEFFSQIQRHSQMDLYDTLKAISWKIFVSTFLDLSDADPDFDGFVKLQEDLLRGQFSLFPASINVGFWHSPRKRGIDARKTLQHLISGRLNVKKPTWIPEDLTKARPPDEIVNHILMATSSLAVKGFASLMLAILLNVFLFPYKQSGSSCLADWIDQENSKERKLRLEAILKETIRLSPPIVGVLRRTTRDCTVPTRSDQEPDTLIPTGFEAWCYFPGANRDPMVFGEDADLFVPERYLGDGPGPPSPVAFGLGPKSCLGAGFVNMAALTIVEALLDAKLYLTGNVEAAGVKGWLGHETATPEQWARDVKQLPTQRPSHPVLVEIKEKI